MIRVTVELDSAITGKTTTLGVLCITNDGTGSKDSGNYQARVVRKNHLHKVAPGRLPEAALCSRTGVVSNYPRLKLVVWRLVLRALLAAYPEERT